MQKNNKEDEFLELISNHQGIVYKICSVYENNVHARQDLFQEIMIQLWQNFEKFRGESSFSTWMYRVAINTAISSFRKKQKILSVATTNENSTYQDVYTTELENQKGQLYQAINALSDLEKAIVMLYLDEKRYTEMEEILGIKEGTFTS